MSEVRTAADHGSPTQLTTLVAAHAAMVVAPLLVVGVLVLPVFVAVVVALAVAAAVTAWRLRAIDGRIVAALGAAPVGDGEYSRLRNVVDSSAMAVGVTLPHLYVVDEPNLNAVTWAAGPGRVSAAFTTGLLDALERIELEAVVGRQLTLARDGRLAVVAVAGALFGPLARGPLEDAVGSLVHHTVDERHVVLADLDGVRATRYPPGLVAALERVRDTSSAMAGAPPWLNAFCFAAPAGDEGPFASHPPIEDRIDLLREI